MEAQHRCYWRLGDKDEIFILAVWLLDSAKCWPQLALWVALRVLLRVLCDIHGMLL